MRCDGGSGATNERAGCPQPHAAAQHVGRVSAAARRVVHLLLGHALVDEARRALRLVLRVVPPARPSEARSGTVGAGAGADRAAAVGAESRQDFCRFQRICWRRFVPPFWQPTCDELRRDGQVSTFRRSGLQTRDGRAPSARSTHPGPTMARIVTSTYRYKPPPKRKGRKLAEITGPAVVVGKGGRRPVWEKAAAGGGLCDTRPGEGGQQRSQPHRPQPSVILS